MDVTIAFMGDFKGDILLSIESGHFSSILYIIMYT